MRFVIFGLLTLSLTSCWVPLKRPFCERVPYTTAATLMLGKRNFERGFYKRAMKDLLPLACDGYPEAQYAVAPNIKLPV